MITIKGETHIQAQVLLNHRCQIHIFPPSSTTPMWDCLDVPCIMLKLGMFYHV